MPCLIVATLAAVLLTAPATAQVQNGSSREKLVVTSAWLAEHLNDRDLVVLQVGRRATYEAGHIPGSRLVDYDGGALHRGHGDGEGLALEMLPAEELRAELAALGVSDNSRVVVVPADGYWSPSTRVVLTLDYAGLSKVMWLDGGLKGWTNAGRSLSTSVPDAKPGALGPLKIRPIVVDAEFVRAHTRTPGYAIVDARNRSFYDGVPPQRAAQGPERKLGHIPGALSAPFDQFATGTDGETKLKSATEIEALLIAAGIKPGDTIVAYCHVGQQATSMLFAARTLGHNVLLYDGSFEDWNKRDLPVDK
jgi:thiosulfate/3-mercaptopyruvate sulfurtransferase